MTLALSALRPWRFAWCAVALGAVLWPVGEVRAQEENTTPEAATAAATTAQGAESREIEPLPADVELTRSVRRNLEQIREQWRQWEQAFFRKEPETAETLVDGLELLAEQLGFERLPDMAVAAAQKALIQARQEEGGPWSAWALDHAERLDPGRPEVAFLRAEAHRSRGEWGTALASELEGYRRLWTLHPSRELGQAAMVIWWLQVAMLTVAGLVVVALLAHGRRLASDFEALLGRTPLGRSPGWLQGLLAVALLVWPVLLPGGFLWVVLLLSALMFAYVSPSLRIALVLGWIVLAVTPTVALEQQERVELALSAPLQGLTGMQEDRLYGRLFQDLGQLSTSLPRDPAVIQTMADLHRRLGQWEIAQELYRQVLEVEPDNVWALMDLGSYYFFNEDYGIARTYFEQATKIDGPQRIEDRVTAYYNLSQCYSQLYLFPKMRETLQQAQDLDDRMVSRLQQQTGQDSIVTFDGGVARRDEIRSRIVALQDESTRSWPILGPLFTVLAVLVLALTFLVLGRNLPGAQTSARGYGRWTRVLVPGLGSVAAGRGGRALLGLVPVVILATLPLADALALPFYPAAGQPGTVLAVLAVFGLGLLLLLRALATPAVGEVA